ncbi:hypothetical protein BaRGS_00004846, partial [Batillaria attramentaria]
MTEYTGRTGCLVRLTSGSTFSMLQGQSQWTEWPMLCGLYPTIFRQAPSSEQGGSSGREIYVCCPPLESVERRLTGE